jgi:hypothetical protein
VAGAAAGVGGAARRSTDVVNARRAGASCESADRRDILVVCDVVGRGEPLDF